VERGVSRYETNVVLYRLKKDPAFRDRFRADPRKALADAELSDEEREAFVRWDARKLNELGGSLHLLISIPGLSGH
jgi:Aromatic-ring-opening dioxygenase LigAB, LigA subunit